MKKGRNIQKFEYSEETKRMIEDIEEEIRLNEKMEVIFVSVFGGAFIIAILYVLISYFFK
mgnify:CR=1 FL=1